MIKPTLPRDYNAEAAHINLADGWLVSAKLDGVRCIATRDGLFSRKWKRITCLPHIAEKFAGMHDNAFYDGELYAHGLGFNKINALCAMREATSEHETLNYCIFDEMPGGWGRATPYLVRACRLIGLPGFLRGTQTASVKYVCQRRVYSQAEVETALTSALGEGYEGIVLRDPHAPYVEGRTNRLLKLKPTCDAEFEIVDIIADKTGLKAGAVACVTHGGEFFRAGIGAGLDDSDKRALLRRRRKLFGKMATIQFQELTPRGVPRFPKFLGIRFDI